MPFESFYLRKRGGNKMIIDDLEKIRAMRDTYVIHGKAVWIKHPDGRPGREMRRIDHPTRTLVTDAEFRELENSRPGRRRHQPLGTGSRGSGYFAGKGVN